MIDLLKTGLQFISANFAAGATSAGIFIPLGILLARLWYKKERRELIAQNALLKEKEAHINKTNIAAIESLSLRLDKSNKYLCKKFRHCNNQKELERIGLLFSEIACYEIKNENHNSVVVDVILDKLDDERLDDQDTEYAVCSLLLKLGFVEERAQNNDYERMYQFTTEAYHDSDFMKAFAFNEVNIPFDYKREHYRQKANKSLN